MTVKTNKLLLKDDNTGLVRDIKQDIQDAAGDKASYHFDGTGDYIECGAGGNAALNIVNNDSPVTVLWAGIMDSIPTVTKYLTDWDTNSLFSLTVNANTGTIRIQNGASNNITCATVMPVGKFTTIAISKTSRTSLQLWMNGNLMETLTTTHTSTNSAAARFSVGGYVSAGTNTSLLGSMYRAIAFNYALTPDKIARYSAGAKLDYEDVGGSMSAQITTAWTDAFTWFESAFSSSGATTFTGNNTAGIGGAVAAVSLPLGKRYRFTFTPSWTGVYYLSLFNVSTGTQDITPGYVACSAGVPITVEFTVTGANTRLGFLSTTTGTLTVTAASLVQLGAVLDLEPEGIIGGTAPIWADSSGNGLHGTVSGALPVSSQNDLVEATTSGGPAGSTTTLVYTDIGMSITLIPGIWEIEMIGMFDITGATGTGVNGRFVQMILTDAANNAIEGTRCAGFANAEQTYCICAGILKKRLTVTTTTTYKGRWASAENSTATTITGTSCVPSALTPNKIRAIRVG
jgi:hypothetical protein